MPNSASIVHRRLTRRYAVALAAFAVASAAGQAVLHASLQENLVDAHVVNMAGRQRMLSQRIGKNALAIRAGLDRADALRRDAAEWVTVHRALLEGDDSRDLPPVRDDAVRTMLVALDPVVEEVALAAAALDEALVADDVVGADRSVTRLLGAEEVFLADMDRVVFALDDRATEAVARLGVTMGLIFLSLLGVFGVVAGVVIRPAAREAAEAVGQLDQHGRLLRTVIDTIPDHIFVKDTEGRATLRNLASARALGFDDPEVAVGRTDADDTENLGKAALSDDLRVISTGEALRNKTERSREGGWLLTTKVPLRAADGAVTGLVGVSRDVTAATEAEARLRVTAERLGALVAHLQDGVLLADEDGRVLLANRRLVDMARLGESPDALVGTEERELIAIIESEACDPAAFEAAVREGREDGVTGQPLALGDGRVLEWDLVPVRLDGSAGGRLWIFTDATARREAEARLYHQAHHDGLTGVPNRTLLTARLDVVAAEAQRGETAPYALLFIDLDRFKAVNDDLGHSAGDRLLCVVADRIQRLVRSSDLVARLGGDEFAVLLEGLPNAAYAERVAERVRATIEAPIHLDGHDLRVGASVGVVVGRPDHHSPDALLREADHAMYRTKRTRKRAA